MHLGDALTFTQSPLSSAKITTRRLQGAAHCRRLIAALCWSLNATTADVVRALVTDSRLQVPSPFDKPRQKRALPSPTTPRHPQRDHHASPPHTIFERLLFLRPLQHLQLLTAQASHLFRASDDRLGMTGRTHSTSADAGDDAGDMAELNRNKLMVCAPRVTCPSLSRTGSCRPPCTDPAQSRRMYWLVMGSTPGLPADMPALGGILICPGRVADRPHLQRARPGQGLCRHPAHPQRARRASPGRGRHGV